MENDENKNPDEQQDATSSSDKTNTADSKAEDNEQLVPYYRFKEVNDKFKGTQSELQELKEELERLKSSKPDEEEQEPADWKEAEKRVVQKAIKEFETKINSEHQKEVEMEQSIDRGFEQLKALGQNITPEIKKQVLEEIVKTGDSVHDAYISVFSRTTKKQSSDQIKTEGNLPNSKSSDDKGNAISYQHLHKLTMDQLIQRAVNKK